MRWHWGKSGRQLDLHSPKLFSEKIEWLKLNDHRRSFIQYCDKLAVRNCVLERTGDSKILNLVYGSYDRAEDIPVDDLPNRFVVKANHYSGGNLLCDQNTLRRNDNRNTLNGYIDSIYSFDGAEWPYWHVKPKLIVEEYLEDQVSQLVDYKVFCFGGEPKIIMVCMDRHNKTRKSNLGIDWNVQPSLNHNYSMISSKSTVTFPRPESLDIMLRYSR